MRIGKTIVGLIGNHHNKRILIQKQLIKLCFIHFLKWQWKKMMIMSKTLAKKAGDKEVPAIVITLCHCRLRMMHTLAVQ
ncbi:MAG TPA: hypothetical protein VE524_00320 [Nitrososphaeraceae archaeon]|nr:hypothetical protein [Nitrososphaeraceae archaeon]